MSTAEGVRTVAQRIAVREDELARIMVERLRSEIVGAAFVEGERGFDEAVRYATANVESLLSTAARGEPIPPALLLDTREIAQQLASAGVSLSALHHAGRVWGAVVWEAVLAAVRDEDPAEQAAALGIGRLIWNHVDVISNMAAYAYLDEVNDRGLMARQLMQALLAGRGETAFADRLARSLHLRLGESYVVVLVRGDGMPVEESPDRPLAARVALDHIVEAARSHLRPTAGSLLAAIRLGDLVVLYPVLEPGDLRRVQQESTVLAGALQVEVSVGMGGWHPGLEGIALGYAEAREAVEIAAGTGIRGRPLALEDVIVDHMLRSSPHAQRMLDALLEPLLEYDRLHHAELTETLRTYLAADASLTETARRLTVHPNTAAYRLRRIRELTGRDPRTLEELLILFLGLKLTELRPPPQPEG